MRGKIKKFSSVCWLTNSSNNQQRIMLSSAAKRSSVGVLRVSNARLYSAHHGASEKHGEEHHHDEHHGDDHGHHEIPLAPAESIINKNTLIFAGIFALMGGFYTANESYKKSNDNKSLVSLLAKPLEDAKSNYDEYRSRVKKQTTVQELMTYPGDRVTADTYIPRDSEVFGRVWASGSNTQFNTIQNWESLPPRKVKESPFY